MPSNEISDEELYKLKEHRMTYKQMVQYFAERGIEIFEWEIGERVRKIYANKNKKVPRGSVISNEELYQLKEKGRTYSEIAEYLSKKGIMIEPVSIGIRIREIYREKGREVPKGKRKKNTMNNLAVCVDNKNQNVTAKETIDAIYKAGFKNVFIQYYHRDRIGLNELEQIDYCKKLGLNIIFCHLGYKEARDVNEIWLEGPKGEEVIDGYIEDFKLMKEKQIDLIV